MDRKQMCVANVQYKKPSDDGAKQSKNLIKYLTYRESREEKARHVSGRERWVDHGMGGSVGEITRQCEALHSDHVLLFSLVLNPNPDLIHLVEPEEREQFVRDLTEQVVEEFFEARGLDTGLEFSYVLHHRSSTDPQSPGRHDPHTHVVLPGTVYDEMHGSRVPLFFSQNQKVNHIEMLHRTTEETMADLMEHYVGPEWEQIYDIVQEVRKRQLDVLAETPHGVMVDDEGSQWPVWCGARCTNESQSAVGYYRAYRIEKENQIEFRPLRSGLSHEEAEYLAQACAVWMERDGNSLAELKALLESLEREDRADLIAHIRQLGQEDKPSPVQGPELDL